MLTRLIGVALLAGCLAGVLAAGLQTAVLQPLILKAETYEVAPMVHNGVAMAMPAASAAGEAAAGEAMGWLSRTAITFVATVGAAVGYGLLLLAAMEGARARIDWRTGLIWGACGFAACGLAPAMGLAPALPGAAEGDLTLRQLWWIGTAMSTAAGLWLALRGTPRWAAAAGAVLLLAPHLIGAPAAAFSSTVPAELASLFTARSLATQSVLWLALGGFTGWFWSRGNPMAS
jgi:cobalt transporter subunit CbtA